MQLLERKVWGLTPAGEVPVLFLANHRGMNPSSITMDMLFAIRKSQVESTFANPVSFWAKETDMSSSKMP